ncbi:MAG: TRAP transporter permease, partial [Chloroflexus sp.]
MSALKPSGGGMLPTSDEIDQEKVRQYLEQEEKPTRSLGRFWGAIVALIAVGMAGFYIYTAGTLPAPVQWQRGIYVML